jgi:acyl-ACP thioesterase
VAGLALLRRHTYTTQVTLGDAAPDGRARLDALARYLQDTAYDDVRDAGLAENGAWVVRRTRIDIERFPVFGEPITATTWCSGLGRLWAERRTSLAGVESTAIWIHLDPATGRPRPLDDEQLGIWRPSAGDRKVKARLTHPDPPDGARAHDWAFRRADLDIAQHVNNAAYLAVAEELRVLAAPCTVEIEYRGAAQAGPTLVLDDGEYLWVCAPDRTVHASIALTMPQ